jgi:hypothetical protein
MPKSKSKAQSSKIKVQKNKTEQPTSRKLKQSEYRSFRLNKRIKQPKPPIKGAFRLFAQSIHTLRGSWKLIGGIVLVYLILTMVLVKGFGVSSNIGQLKNTIEGVFHGGAGQISEGLTLFSVLLSNVNSTTSDVAGAYQSMLLIIISLALIWALRQSLGSDKQKPKVRTAFYQGMYPLIPFLVVLVVIGLQLIPLLIANFLYATVITGGLAVTAIEKGLWVVMLGLLGLLSLYMITSSIFGLYIVTLPDVTPLQALRSARDLVRHRRWLIMRKVLFLPVALLVSAAVLIIPLIIVAPAVAEWLFFVLSMLALAIVHSYLYNLYRELL